MTQKQRRFLQDRLNELVKIASSKIDVADRRDHAKQDSRIRRNHGRDLLRLHRQYRILRDSIGAKYGVEVEVRDDREISIYRSEPRRTERRERMNHVAKSYRTELALGRLDKVDAFQYEKEMSDTIEKASR
jgi:hypothetical protein